MVPHMHAPSEDGLQLAYGNGTGQARQAFFCVISSCCVTLCRDSDMQLGVLDRIGGTQTAAANFGSQLRRLRALDAQLAAIDALGDEDTRSTLQRLVDEVRATSIAERCAVEWPGRVPSFVHDLASCCHDAQHGRATDAAAIRCCLRIFLCLVLRQVRAVGVEEGEERRLRAQLRQMESRRAAVERCSLVCFLTSTNSLHTSHMPCHDQLHKSPSRAKQRQISGFATQTKQMEVSSAKPASAWLHRCGRLWAQTAALQMASPQCRAMCRACSCRRRQQRRSPEVGVAPCMSYRLQRCRCRVLLAYIVVEPV